MTRKQVIDRLDRAGAALLALTARPHDSRNLLLMGGGAVRAALQSYGWTQRTNTRLPSPPAEDLAIMNKTMEWIRLIPEDRYVLRRIVAARCLVHPITRRHLFPWRRLAAALGVDRAAVKRWHAEGIDLIVERLRP